MSYNFDPELAAALDLIPEGTMDLSKPVETREAFMQLINMLNAGLDKSGRITFWDFHTYYAGRRGSELIYDVADHVTGRRWKDPFRLPAYAAFIYQGPSIHNDRGFYNTDILRVSCAMHAIEKVFPELVWEPDRHIKDRILYRGLDGGDQ